MINRYRQRYLCEPIYSRTGRLRAVEMLTAFTTPDGESVSWGGVSDILTPEYKWLNFVRQLRCLRQCQNWFLRHQVFASLNLDAETAVWLLRDRGVLTSLATLPFLRLEVHEQFDNDGLLHHLRPYASLWLDDVGSGSRDSFRLLVSGVFSGAKIDKAFFWRHHAADAALLGKVIRDLVRYAGHVVVEGIEHQGHRLSLPENPRCWLQGYLFQRTPVEEVSHIPLNIRNTCVAPL